MNTALVLARIVIPLAIRGTGYALFMMAMSLTTVWKSTNEASQKVAADWLTEVGKYGMDSRYDGALYWIVRASVFMILAIGWVFLAYLTVWVFTWFF